MGFLSSEQMKAAVKNSGKILDSENNVLFKPLIENVDPEQMDYMEGGAYDLRIDEVYVRDDQVPTTVIGIDKSITPRVKLIHPRSMLFNVGNKGMNMKGWKLSAGTPFLVKTMERVNLPLDMIGFLRRRSSLFRGFIQTQETFIHPNYQGALTFFMECGNETYLEHGARITVLKVYQMDSEESNQYKGRWQGGEKVTSQGEEIGGF